MSWCALDVRAGSEDRDTVAAWLVDRTGQAVEERDDGVLTSFAESQAAAEAFLAALQDAFGGRVQATSRLLPSINWAEQWRAGLGPRTIGRLVVTPSWTAPSHTAIPTVVIDPETAFGTGEHGSTRTVLMLMDRHLAPGDRVLDLGSGSGILAIAAAKLGASRATGIEVDADADPIATANAARNHVTSSVSFLTGDAVELVPLLAPVELIVSNILRSINIALLPTIRDALVPDGIAVFGGMETLERDAFLHALADAEFSPLDEVIDDAWWGVAARRG